MSVITAHSVKQRYKIPDYEAFKLLSDYGIPHLPYGFARTPEEAGKIAAEIGFPVALKVVSPNISHKTDVGGVVLNLLSTQEVVKEATNMLERIRARLSDAIIEGFLVQKMAKPGIEVIIGGLRDPVFGVILMFGLGGIFTEVFRDVTFRVWPITLEEALEMMREIKSKAVLQGYRGMQPVDVSSLADIVVKLGKLLEDHEEIESADLNPVIAYPNGAVVVDARFILSQQLH